MTSRAVPPPQAPPRACAGIAPTCSIAGRARRRCSRAAAPTHLLHLAWYAEHGPFWTSTENLRWAAATIALVQAFAERGGRRAVLAGTCAEYRWGEPGPCVEGVTPLEPATLYGTAKHATRAVLEAAAGELGHRAGVGARVLPLRPRRGARPARRVGRARARRRRARGDRRRHAGPRLPARRRRRGRVRRAARQRRAPARSTSARARRARCATSSTRSAPRPGAPDLLDIGALPPRPGDPAELVADVARLRDEVGFVAGDRAATRGSSGPSRGGAQQVVVRCVGRAAQLVVRGGLRARAIRGAGAGRGACSAA